MKPVIAVLDIGKTNKKVAFFDMDLHMLEARRCQIDAVTRGDIRVEDLERIEAWFLEQLASVAERYTVRAISIATHGAAVVCVGEDGRPLLPSVDYTQPVDDSLHQRFFDEMGSPGELQQSTATTEIRPLINVGKQLFFLRERYPREFPQIRHVLLYPQYFAFRLTGCATADITYVGCHSYLWDPNRNDWSVVVDRLGIRDKLPAWPVLPTEVIGTVTPEVAMKARLHRDVVVTAGIHDSNSSLLPYLITRKSDFVLNSTGTWCVAMHPTRETSFAPDEIGKMVFYNLSYAGTPVKTSILMGGLEYDTYRRLLEAHHQRSDDPALDRDLLAKIIRDADTFVLPSVVPGSGQFPDSAARIVERSSRVVKLQEIEDGTAFPHAFEDYETALALVDLSVAIQTVIALRRVGLAAGTDLFIEGGFRNNRPYLEILTALLPDNPISLTSVEEATSFGAALCARAALEQRPVEELADTVSLEVQPVTAIDLPGINAYATAFERLLH